jgi:transcriptional regulator with XRE-family HTH domain
MPYPSFLTIRIRHIRVKFMSEKFPELLRRAREDKRLSQTDLAERTGLQPSAVSHFETGKRAPSFENLKRLADALAVSVDYLLGRTDEAKGSGPVVEQLFRDFSRMSSSDQESIAKFAAMLAEKNEAGTRKRG